MDEETQDDSEVLETPEETVEETIEETTEEETPELSKEEIEALKAKAAKVDDLEKKNKQLFERAKKQTVSNTQTNTLSPMDAVLLSKSDVAAEDIDEVLGYAKFRKITIAEALKDTTLKAILKEKNEERLTAAAAQTKGGARGSSKVSGIDLLTKAETTGEVPETAEGMRALAEARLARKKAALS